MLSHGLVVEVLGSWNWAWKLKVRSIIACLILSDGHVWKCSVNFQTAPKPLLIQQLWVSGGTGKINVKETLSAGTHRICLNLSYEIIYFKGPSQERKIHRQIAARRVLHQILPKSGGRRQDEHSWSAHPAVIGRCLEHFNSQLKFAGWSADVTQINSSAGAPWGAARSPAGRRSATGGNLGCNWRKKTHRRPHGHPPFAVGTPDGDPVVICRQPRHGKSPNGDRTATCRRLPGDRWIIAWHVNIISCDFHLERLVGCIG